MAQPFRINAGNAAASDVQKENWRLSHASYRLKLCIEKLCYRKWLMLFSLKLQRDNRKNALTVDPAKGKNGGKGCIFAALWR